MASRKIRTVIRSKFHNYSNQNALKDWWFLEDLLTRETERMRRVTVMLYQCNMSAAVGVWLTDKRLRFYCIA